MIAPRMWECIRQADIALYAAKKTGGAFYSIYNAELATTA